MPKNDTQRSVVMRKMILFMLWVLCISMFIGCGSVTTKKQNAMVISDKGNVEASSYGSFDKEYYDAAELKQQIQDAIDEYNDTNGSDRIKLKKCSKDKDGVHLVITYESGDDYTAFNGVQCYVGKLGTAVSEGAADSSVRITSSDGSLKTTIGELNNKSGTELNILIIEEPLVVSVPQAVQYISGDVQLDKNGNCIVGEDSKGETVLDSPSYIVFGKQ